MQLNCGAAGSHGLPPSYSLQARGRGRGSGPPSQLLLQALPHLEGPRCPNRSRCACVVCRDSMRWCCSRCGTALPPGCATSGAGRRWTLPPAAASRQRCLLRQQETSAAPCVGLEASSRHAAGARTCLTAQPAARGCTGQSTGAAATSGSDWHPCSLAAKAPAAATMAVAPNYVALHSLCRRTNSPVCVALLSFIYVGKQSSAAAYQAAAARWAGGGGV